MDLSPAKTNNRRSGAPSYQDYENEHEQFFLTVKTFFHNLDGDTMLMQLSRDITVLVPLDRRGQGGSLPPPGARRCSGNNAEIVDIAKRAKSYVEKRFPTHEISVGIGRECSVLTQLHQSYQEARKALQLGKSIWGQSSVVHYDNLGIFRILHSADPKELRDFAHEVLSPIQVLQGADTLLRTLQVFFLENESVSDTARVLYVHPNTVRYRLRKVEQHLHLDFSDRTQRMNVDLALKIRRLITE